MIARGLALVRVFALVIVLGLVALVVPDSGPASTEVALVRLQGAAAVDHSPRVIWILAVGSDARPGESMTRARGDALQLVGINTATGSASAIGIPRDAWVTIPGHGRDKINAALTLGGPSAMGRAVGDLVGVRPDYVMVTRFPFFEQMIDDIGGIEVRNPRAFSDPYLNRVGFKAGPIRLNGYGAMAFSRIRKSLPGGDFARSANQQRTLRGIHWRIRERADQPGFLERGVMTVLKHTATNARPAELFALATAVAHVDPRRVTTCVVSGGLGYVGSQSVVFPNVAQARRWGRDARLDATIKHC